MQYYNKEKKKFYTEGTVLTWLEQGKLHSRVPSKEQLARMGYEPYSPPVAEPTEYDIRRERMGAIAAELAAMDYLTSKEQDGEDMSQYNDRYGGDWHAYRRALRKEYNELEGKTAT